MGASPSKATGEDALVLCKERMRHIKRAIDSRDALSAAHLSYTQSLRSVETALWRYAESEISPESSLSISEVDKSPSHSSMASPSPSRAVENISSPVHRGSQLTASTKIHYLKAAGTTPLTITIDPSAAEFVEQESPISAFVPPPPPLPPELCTSWDFFDPIDAAGSATSNNEHGLTLNFGKLKGLRDLREAKVVSLREEAANNSDRTHPELPDDNAAPKQETQPKQSGMSKPSGSVDASTEATSSWKVVAKVEDDEMERELGAEIEDPSEFITHRAKDFVSSMKDIKFRFIRAAEAGNEVSRMLETKKIRLDICAKMPGAFLFFVLLGLSGCFVTCYDRRVRSDLAQPCRELCLCCCQPGMCADCHLPGTLCMWTDCTTCFEGCATTAGECGGCLGGAGEAGLPLLFIMGVIALGLFTVIGIFYSVLVATMVGQRIWQRHYHILAKRMLTKEYVVEDVDGERTDWCPPALPGEHVQQLKSLGLL